MKNIEICREKRTILVSKEYYKEACVYGTEEYNELKSIALSAKQKLTGNK
jgi:hypothetical protein